MKAESSFLGAGTFYPASFILSGIISLNYSWSRGQEGEDFWKFDYSEDLAGLMEYCDLGFRI